jgi:hypothetical protein
MSDDDDSETEKNNDIIDNLMNLELDMMCQITKILNFPIYPECCHVDSVQHDDQIKCPRCELIVKMIEVNMPADQKAKAKYDQ